MARAAEPEPLRVLTEEEMEARVARKMELLRQRDAAATGRSSPAMDPGEQQIFNQQIYESSIRSDFNPDAGVNLRSRSIIDNAKASLAKQEELKKRDKKQKRDDLCEMLGRGC